MTRGETRETYGTPLRPTGRAAPSSITPVGHPALAAAIEAFLGAEIVFDEYLNPRTVSRVPVSVVDGSWTGDAAAAGRGGVGSRSRRRVTPLDAPSLWRRRVAGFAAASPRRCE